MGLARGELSQLTKVLMVPNHLITSKNLKGKSGPNFVLRKAEPVRGKQGFLGILKREGVLAGRRDGRCGVSADCAVLYSF